jgi:tetratricopeptide (TPR) repeat protein
LTTRRPTSGGFAAAEGTPPLPALTLRLEPPPADDAAALVRSAADRDLSDEDVRSISERAAGNPLFLQELASDEEPREEAEELPETVEALVAIRIDRLAPADRALLRWASVLGESFAGADIADVLAGDPSAASGSEAWDRLAEFIERDPDVPGGFRFRHVLIRDAAYEGLSYRRRRELHASVAEVVEARHGDAPEEAAELLSLHFLRAGRSDDAWRYSVTAGRRAQDKWSNVEAAEFYRRALDVASSARDAPDTEVAGVWDALGDALRLTGDFDEAARAFASARRLLPKEDPQQVLLMRKEGDLREHMGKYSEALRWYGRGLKAAEQLEDEALRTHHRIRFRLAHAEVRFRQGAFKESIRRCREVVDEALEAGDLQSLAPAYLLLHLVYTLLGSPERVAFRGLALPIYEELGDLKGQATVLGNLGVEAYYEGDWTKALDLYERSRALSERLGDVSKVAMQTNNVAEIRSDQGHLEEAERMFLEVERVCRPAGQRALATVARANLGRVAARAGRLDEAEELLSAALEDFRELHIANFVVETELRLTEVQLLRGDRPDEVLGRTNAVLERAEEAADMAALQASTLRLRAAARLQLGEAEAANADLERSVEVARGADALYEVALALDLRAASGDDDARTESAALLERLGVERVVRPPLLATS